jgi:hypothetical protein
MTRWLWEGPQTLLGLASFAAQRALGNVEHTERRHGRMFVKLRGAGAVSLGHFVFWSTEDTRFVRVNPHNDLHEWGHARQSALLGPAYLLVVGIPSALRAVYAVAQWPFTRRPWAGYYDGFPERWADRLGGVERARHALSALRPEARLGQGVQASGFPGGVAFEQRRELVQQLAKRRGGVRAAAEVGDEIPQPVVLVAGLPTLGGAPAFERRQHFVLFGADVRAQTALEQREERGQP